jgi:proteic killer suppression protein
VDVLFPSQKLQRQLSNQRDLRRLWGKEGAKRITARLQQLTAAVTLEDMRSLPGRCHELTGQRAGELAIDLHQGYRLIFIPAENPPPTKEDGGLDWRRVDSVTVIEIVDYH